MSKVERNAGSGRAAGSVGSLCGRHRAETSDRFRQLVDVNGPWGDGGGTSGAVPVGGGASEVAVFRRCAGTSG